MNTFEDDVEEIVRELVSVLVAKQHDYGPLNISQAPGGPINGLLVRMNDKMARLINLWYARTSSPKNESLEDSFIDLANYSVIALMVMRDKWPKP